MQSFLAQVAQYLTNNYSQTISELCIVLPSRRGVSFFKKELAKIYKKPLFSPSFYSIEDFFSALSPYKIATPEEQLMNLYSIHLEIENARENKLTPLFQFAPQAKIILQDFNELDLELIDPDALFNNLSDIKELSFWSPNQQNLSTYQKQQIRFFKDLYTYYQEFKHKLHVQNKSYQGDIYRYVAMHANEIFSEIVYKKIVFVGFNALAKSEKLILKELHKKNLLDYLVDADTFYVNNENHEAGKFIREIQKNIFTDTQLNFIGNYFQSTQNTKEINILAVPHAVMQAKTLSEILSNLQVNQSDEKTVVVPSDETNVPLLLHSYDWKTANITMSYSIKRTLLYQLLDTIFTIVSNQENVEDFAKLCHARDIQALLSNGIILELLKNDESLQNFTQKTKFFYKKQDFFIIFKEKHHVFAELFGKILFEDNTIVDFVALLQEMLLFLSQNINFDDMDKEILLQFLNYFDNLSNLLNNENSTLTKKILLKDIQSLRFLFNNFISSYALSFQSDSDSSLQMMGMLETRTLDFDNVIILSLNEGILPNGKATQTFIPYDLRRYFSMQTFDGKDAVSAYHFYRLLQRSKQVFLIYTLNDDNSNKGKSRFLLQIEQELSQYCKINHQTIVYKNPENQKNKEISIEKTEKDIVFLKNYAYSATSLSEYLQCSLKFYFSRILKIDQKNTEEEIGDDIIGSVIHSVLKDFGNTNFENISNIEEKTLETFEKLGYSADDLQIEYNYLIFRIVIKYIENYVNYYQKHISEMGKIIAMEKEIQTEIYFPTIAEKIHLKGIIDRIDIKDNFIMIWDYKTGRIEDYDCSVDSIEKILSGDKPKAFQLLFYTLLYNEVEHAPDIRAGIISLRNLKKNYILTINKDKNINNQILEDFKKGLETIFIDIFDEKKSFKKTINQKNCQYCNFANICGRTKL